MTDQKIDTEITPMSEEPVREWEANVYEFLTADIPESAMNAGSNVVLNVVAATVAGSTVSAHQHAQAAPLADGNATVLGTDKAYHPTHSALLNTAAAITPEIEEGHNWGGHVGASIVAGAIGVAEAENCSGEEFVKACVRSYELCVRIEYAIFAMKAKLNEAVPWLLRDPHATWTTIGPALTAAQCMGATEEQLREVFRTAANLAVISMHDPYEEGAPARNFTAGYSAQAGVSAAILAMSGVKGSATAIADVYDPFQSMLEEGEFDRLFSELGTVWEIENAYFKWAPSCRYTHPPLDALEQMDIEAIRPSEIESIDVYTYANAVAMGQKHPKTMTGAKFSIPYVLARRLVDGPLELADFMSAAVADTATQQLADRVNVHHDDAFEAAFPDEWGASVEVTLTSGETLHKTCPYPKGDYRNPLSETAFRSLCKDLFATAVGDETAQSAVDGWSEIMDTEIRSLIELLSPK